MTSTDTAIERSFIPFRSKSKLIEHNTPYENQTIPKFIAKKQNNYALHHLHGPHTWIIDYLYIRPNGEVVDNEQANNLMIVFAMMHCNSRLFLGFIADDRSAETFRYLLERYFTTGLSPRRIDVLISDYEPSFGLDVRKNDAGEYVIINDGSNRDKGMAMLYKNRRIEHIGYNTSADKGAHAKLALIDRMARTLRDMIYNARRNDPSFVLNDKTLIQLFNYYNNTSHNTLSSIMGFKVTPFNAYANQDLQNEICRRIMVQNYHTINRINYEKIDVGKEVWVYQPPVFGKKRRNTVEDDPYEVIEVLGPAGYRVRNKKTGIEKIRTRMNLVAA